MSRTTSPSGGRPYGLALVCRVWGVARSTVYRHREPPRTAARRRPGPAGPMPDADLLEAIRAVLAASPFHGEGHRKLWARLRFAGIRTSRRRVLRLMRAHGLLAPQRAGRPRGPKAHDGTITTERVDLMWGTDLTFGDNRRGPGGRARGGRPLLGRVRRRPCQPARRAAPAATTARSSPRRSTPCGAPT